MFPFIRLMRPHHWTKNIFVFAPLFFSGQFIDFHLLANATYAFFAYCFAASSIYCLNDILDRENDRKHPKKRLRPIASGEISVKSASVLALSLITASFSILWLCFNGEQLVQLSGLIGGYIVLNIAYGIKLKRIVLLDIFIVSFGFVMRIFAGSFATAILLSEWLVLMTFLLALFLAMAKRRDDVVLFEQTGNKMRRNITRYNLPFINQSLSIIATTTIVCYILYTMSPEVIQRIGNRYLYLTTLFVLLGILRYLQLTIVDTKSGSPTHILLHDRFIQLCILGWIATFFIILYI